LTDKLPYISVHLHLHGPRALIADARVERVVRRHVHGRTCSREVTWGKHFCIFLL